MPHPPKLCPDSKLQALISAMRQDNARAEREVGALIAEYPADARLHFLKGSLLAGQEDYSGAKTAMRRAVDLAPHYAIARFQLGLLLLTAGEPIPAQEAWGPLHSLPADYPLRLFAEGLSHLIRDEFDATIRALEAGIARNSENAPLNRDMAMVIDAIKARRAEGAAVSAVDQLLRQAMLRSTRH